MTKSFSHLPRVDPHAKSTSWRSTNLVWLIGEVGVAIWRIFSCQATPPYDILMTLQAQDFGEVKGPISSEKYWYYFHCPKNVLRSILIFVFWIFPHSDTAVQLESADSKQNEISKYLFQDSFRHIFCTMRTMYHTFWKKPTFSEEDRKKERKMTSWWCNTIN